jgi:hypothetical protein
VGCIGAEWLVKFHSGLAARRRRSGHESAL